MFQLAWAGMLRSSELVGFDWSHVYYPSVGGVLLFLPHSKTDPGEGAWVVLAPGHGVVDPARALRRLQDLKGGDRASGPVFRPRLGATGALAKGTVAIRLRKALERTGVASWRLYAAHSLRRGGATQAVACGVSLRLIKLMGRWKSDIVRECLYCSPSQVMEASARMY
eukprot:GHUV01031690.1.p2 GENE.GHUV01031690.1~~GHUV01031690.1.p2  ORF type:complete len:168 (+),score=6.39 GHUV01031690.1:522-1025(+)